MKGSMYDTPEGICEGDTFGLLTVIKFEGRNERYQAQFSVRCSCGETVVVSGSNLKRGNTTRCRSGKHRAVHSMTDTAEYISWKAMNWRVKSKNPRQARWYRDKGITVYGPWAKSFTDFLSHIGMMPKPGLTLDRIDGDKNYEPGNVRWATWKQQALNKKKKDRD